MRRYSLSAIVISVLAASCSSAKSNPVGVVGAPAKLAIVSGNNQQGVVGTELAGGLIVSLEDAAGHGVPGQSVTFVVTSGGGSLLVPSGVTDADGKAATRWTLGIRTSQAQNAEARFVDPNTGAALVVKFSATSLPGSADSLVDLAGNDQVGPPDTALADSLAVAVQDVYGNPVPGTSVAWSATGGGTLSPGISQADSAGVARTLWTLGPATSGSQSVSASVAGLKPVEFFAAFPIDTGTWQTMAPMPFAVRSPAVATDGTRIYVMGGTDPSGNPTHHTQIYDPATNSWSIGADLPIAVDFATAVAFDGIIHLFGGQQPQAGITTQQWIYTPATDSWAQGTSMLEPASGATAQVVNGKTYVIAGVNALRDWGQAVQVYDLAQNTWIQGPPYPVPATETTSAVLNGDIYVAGGSTTSLATLQRLSMFNPNTGTWSQLADMPVARAALGSGVSRGWFCVFGGRIAASGGFNTPYSDTYCYNPSSDTWSTEAHMPTARAEVASVTLDSWIYAIGGHDAQDVPLATVERFSF